MMMTFFMPMVALLSFFVKMNSAFMSILAIELFVLALLYILSGSTFMVFLLFIIMSVTSGVFGLCILVYYTRSYGSDMITNFYL